MNLTNEIYYTLYNNIENPNFLAKKLELELNVSIYLISIKHFFSFLNNMYVISESSHSLQIGKQLLQNPDFIALGFESLTILTMNEIVLMNDKPTNVQVETIIMFGKNITKTNFQSKWDEMYNENNYLQEILGLDYDLLGIFHGGPVNFFKNPDQKN